MKERGVGTPWSAEEDSLLRQAVAIHGECDNWKQVALSVPGRTNKACRKRWLHSLSPSIKKTAWTSEEDTVLVGLYDTHGPKWSVIARKIHGRTDDACSKRYREALDPSLKKDEWTHEEDDRLTNVYARMGGKWGDVGRELNRSGLACRNRWRMLERKKAAAARDGSSQQSTHLPTTNISPRQLPLPADIASIHWAQSMSSMPVIDPNQYWDSHSADYSRLIQAESVEQSSPFLPTHFSPLSTATQELHSSPPSPPPFQFTSSSLSSALSIPARSPVHAEVGSTSQVVSPVLLQPISLTPLSNAEVQDLTPNDSPHHDMTNDDIADLERPTNGYEDTEQSQDSAAGGAPFPVNSSHRGPLLLLTPPGEIPSLPRLSPALASGTAGEDNNSVSSPHTSTPSHSYPSPVEKFAGFFLQSLPRMSSAEAVGTAGEDIQYVSSSPVTANSYYRTPAEKAAKPAAARKRHERDRSQPRLSSKLAAASDILAYACGHPQCWSPDATTSRYCFLTSQQLSDHWKVEHNSDDIGPNSFRCSLAGCGKGWKSINGLQYHLQISKAHFQRALASIPMPEVETSPLSDAIESTMGGNRPKKLYSCPHDQCRNQYKQLSGLRYHLSHGHSQELPAQLDSVPPALAEKFAQKLQKHANHLLQTD